MKDISRTPAKSGFRREKLAAALALAAILGLSLTPAYARDDRRVGVPEREWRGHERQAYSWHRHHPAVIEEEGPAVVYAPPTDYYAPDYYPPPPSPGINLFLPLNFR